MTNILRKILVLGTLGLALAGCNYIPIEHMEGKFRGYKTVVDKNGDTLSIEMIAPGYAFNLLKGAAVNNSTNFDKIEVVAASIEGNPGLLPDSPLFKYANSDSLNIAYDSVLIQTLRKEERVK